MVGAPPCPANRLRIRTAPPPAPAPPVLHCCTFRVQIPLCTWSGCALEPVIIAAACLGHTHSNSRTKAGGKKKTWGGRVHIRSIKKHPLQPRGLPPPPPSLLLLLGFCWFANPQNDVEWLVLTMLCQIGPPVVGRWRGST